MSDKNRMPDHKEQQACEANTSPTDWYHQLGLITKVIIKWKVLDTLG